MVWFSHGQRCRAWDAVGGMLRCSALCAVKCLMRHWMTSCKMRCCCCCRIGLPTLWHCDIVWHCFHWLFGFEVWRSLDNSPRTHGQVQVLKWFGVANPDALPFQVGSQFVHSHLPLLFCDYYESARPDFGLGPWWIFQFTLSYTNPCRGFGKDKIMQDFMNYLHIYSPSNSGTGWIFAWIRWGSGGHQYPHAPWPAKRVASCHESLDLLQNLRRM